MATSAEYMEYVCGQLELVGDLSYRKMFGEYGLYSQGKYFGAVCDNRFMVKITEGGKRLLGECEYGLPYEGAKPMLVPDCLDDKELLAELVRVTCAELPMPKKKKS